MFIMPLFTNSNGGQTKKLTDETALALSNCHHITYGGDGGWRVAYGKNEDESLVIAVHANSDTEIVEALARISK